MRDARPIRRSVRRGSTVMIVVWAIALASLIATSIQLIAYRQATIGSECTQRIQARWAARAGVENAIATFALHTQEPWPDDAFALVSDLSAVASGELYDASYDIQHHVDGVNWAGPFDEHSRMNVNLGNNAALGTLEDITPDVVSAISDWIDEDDEPGMLGAESDYYQAMSTPVSPRNGPLRSIAEMELIAGIWGDYVRGEDWNMNNRLDPNENDGARSLPDDQPDGILETGWRGRLTVDSLDGGVTDSGLPRIHLRWAEPIELEERCFLEPEQAEIVVAYGKNVENSLNALISTPITFIDANGQISTEETSPDVAPLTREQLRAVLHECSMTPLYERRPGRINLNTAQPDLVRDLIELNNLDMTIAEEIIYLRNSRAQGLTSILDLFDIPNMTPELVQQLAETFTTSSNVYTISSRGRSAVSGIEVEIIAVIDRSTVPIRIMEYREQ